MSRVSRADKKQRELQLLEQEFSTVLIPALKSCKDGGRGVFLTTEQASGTGYSRFVWPETKQLEELGERIADVRGSLGLSVEESVYGLFLKYCRITGPNAPGASKLAEECLRELEAKSQ
jgi:hypothetical protein